MSNEKTFQVLELSLVSCGVIAAVYFAIYCIFSWRLKRGSRFLIIAPFISSLIATTVFSVWGNYSTITSRSSTAAIGLIIFPIVSVAVAIVSFLVIWALVYAVRFGAEQLGGFSNKLTAIPWLVVALLILGAMGYGVIYGVQRYVLLKTASTGAASSRDFERVFTRAIATHDSEVLSALAANQNTSAAQLAEIANVCKINGSASTPNDSEVLYSLAQNTNTPPEILAILANSADSAIRLQTGMNPGTPIEALTKLATDNDNIVRAWLTSNPKLPRDLLRKMRNDPDSVVRGYAEANDMSRK